VVGKPTSLSEYGNTNGKVANVASSETPYINLKATTGSLSGSNLGNVSYFMKPLRVVLIWSGCSRRLSFNKLV
jgi:hypothetical protein